MQYRKNDDALGLRDVENAVREATNNGASDVFVHDWESHRVATNYSKDGIDLQQKLMTEANDLALVPREGRLQIAFGLRSDDELGSQEPLRIRALTTSHDEPAVGSARYAANLRSSSSR